MTIGDLRERAVGVFDLTARFFTSNSQNEKNHFLNGVMEVARLERDVAVANFQDYLLVYWQGQSGCHVFSLLKHGFDLSDQQMVEWQKQAYIKFKLFKNMRFQRRIGEIPEMMDKIRSSIA